MSLLEVKKLSVNYDGADALSNVSFKVSSGSWLMIVGPNGAGKSTILKAISRGVPYAGQILMDGREVRGIPPVEYAREVGVLSQNHTVGFGFTVEEVVRMGRYAYKKSALSGTDDSDEVKVAQALEMTGLAQLKDKSILEISGGELQRTFLAQVLAQDPKFILLDEPVNHLDLVYQKRVLELLFDWMSQKKRAVVSVVHDLSLAKAYGTDVLLLNKGCAAAYGKIDEALRDDVLNEVYGMDVSAWNRALLDHWR